MQKPLVSVVMPTRDCRDYLEKSIASIFAQNIPNLEIIIVDDGSTDGSMEYLCSVAEKYKNIHILQSDGIGPGRARNFAIRAAKADYIAFLDADDVWMEGKLARQLDFHQSNPDVGLSFTNYSIVTPDGPLDMTSFDYWGCQHLFAHHEGYQVMRDAESLILRHNIVGTSCVVAKRECLQNAKGFSSQLQSATDWDMWLKLSQAAPIGVSNEVGMEYLMRADSISANRQKRIDAMTQIVQPYRQRSEPEIKAALRMADANIAIARAELNQESGRNWQAIRHYVTAIIKKPTKRSIKAAGHSTVSGLKNTLTRDRAA